MQRVKEKLSGRCRGGSIRYVVNPTVYSVEICVQEFFGVLIVVWKVRVNFRSSRERVLDLEGLSSDMVRFKIE
jgi:hypothetical protein